MKEEKVEFLHRTVFEFSDYKAYLKEIFQVAGSSRGLRSKLAQALRCQTAFVSGVLNGSTDFSLEHAYQISLFLNHTEEERKYFLVLVQLARAGSKGLRLQFQREAEEIVKSRVSLQSRIRQASSLSDEHRAIYYGKWYYSAIHILTMIPEFRNRPKISAHLNLEPEVTSSAVEFLLSCGLLIEAGHELKPGLTRIHVSSDSGFAAQHHANWRMKAIQSLDRVSKENLHYTLVLSASESDIKKIEGILLSALESLEKILPESRDEALYCLGVDFVRV